METTPSTSNNLPDKRRFFYAVFFPAIISFFLLLVFALEKLMEWDFHTAGIFPRQLSNLWGILTMPFIHSDWEHLFNNTLSFFLLSTSLYYFYNAIASKVLFLSYILSGLLLWIIGRDSWHIGASGIVYALAFFLFFSGIIRKHIPLIAISLIVAFLYGSIVWHLFPWQIFDPVSWEGHLSGAAVGLVLSLIYKNQGPQKPAEEWEEEDDATDDDSQANIAEETSG